MNETRAIDLCLRHRDTAGFDFLVKEYRAQAFRHAFGWLGNREDAADACQDAFKKAYLAMPRLASLDRFYPWFYRILKNHCLNQISRRQTAERNRPELEAEANLREADASRVAVETQENDAAVHAALELLKPEFREILVLKYFSDFSYQQISETLGISRGTVMSRLYYARSAFKVEIEQLEH